MARTRTRYEWCIETQDRYEDVIDANFSDTLDFPAADFETENGESTKLLLVRYDGNELDGIEDMNWAYVKDGKLPEMFSNAEGNEIGIAVPKRFHKELSNYQQSHVV